MPELRTKVLRFANQMEQALRRNDWKGGWSGCSIIYLKRKLREETKELFAAISKGRQEPELIVREAADVANFAMMIADCFCALDEEAACPYCGKAR